MAEGTACRLDNCTKPVKRAGLCYGHYMKQWRYGDPMWQPRPKWTPIEGRRFGALVVVERHEGAWLCRCDCGAYATVAAGDLNRGTATTCGDRPTHHRRDDVGYSGAHQRVRSDRGSVRHHRCVDCGSQARHWSYDHNDPDQRWGTSGRSTCLVPYSLNPQNYSPRCVPCHKVFDLASLVRPGGGPPLAPPPSPFLA